MIVKLHPGQTQKLSAYLEGQQVKNEFVYEIVHTNIQSSESSVHLSDPKQNGGEEKEDNRNSICGLEISFTSMPQDIDITPIPCNDINN